MEFYQHINSDGIILPDVISISHFIGSNRGGLNAPPPQNCLNMPEILFKQIMYLNTVKLHSNTANGVLIITKHTVEAIMELSMPWIQP